MKDWRKRFRSFWTAINKDYELNFETGDDRRVSGEVEDFIFSVLTTQKESFIKILESKRKKQLKFTTQNGMTNAEIWGYNQAIDDIKAELTILEEKERWTEKIA